MTQSVDLLFISAHADDTELSCGGTIAKAVKDGMRVGMIDLSAFAIFDVRSTMNSRGIASDAGTGGVGTDS